MEINNLATKNAKQLYKEKGIIKASVIRHEIIMSWERTRIQEKAMDKVQIIHNQVTGSPIPKYKLDKMQYILSKLKGYSSFFVNKEGYIVLSNISHKNFYAPQSFIEGVCGTTAFSVTRVTLRPFKVYYSEHYMDRFDGYISYCTGIKELCDENGSMEYFLLIFDDKEIVESEIEFVIQEAGKYIEIKENAKSEKVSLKANGEKNIYHFTEEEFLDGGASRETDYKFPPDLKYYLIGISQKIMNIKEQLVQICENHRFSRVFSDRRSSAIACCDFIYESWINEERRARYTKVENDSLFSLLEDGEYRWKKSEDKSVVTELHIINKNSDVTSLMEDLQGGRRYYIIIDSLNIMSYKSQLGITKLLELLFKKGIDFKVTAIFYEGLSEEWINQTVIPSLHSLAAAPKVEYMDIDVRKEDAHLVAREMIRNKNPESTENRYNDDFIRGISDYYWKNGVYQLINYLEFLLERLTNEEILDKSSLPVKEGKKEDVREEIREASHSLLNMEDAERTTIKEALEACNGNITGASKALGISRTTLYRKIEKYGI